VKNSCNYVSVEYLLSMQLYNIHFTKLTAPDWGFLVSEPGGLDHPSILTSTSSRASSLALKNSLSTVRSKHTKYVKAEMGGYELYRKILGD
jgi:hypothetical protein